MQQKQCDKCGGTGQLLDPIRLKRQRRRAELSQRTMAKRMGITASYLCDLEHGRRDWNAQLDERFRAALCK